MTHLLFNYAEESAKIMYFQDVFSRFFD